MKRILLFTISFIFFFLLTGSKSVVWASDCGSCFNIVADSYCNITDASKIVCTNGSADPPWSRLAKGCCRGQEVQCELLWDGTCKYYSLSGNCVGCYLVNNYTLCLSTDCAAADCCVSGEIIAGHCELAVNHPNPCWHSVKYKVCCKNDGSGTEAPCSRTGTCASQAGNDLCPAGYTATAPNVLTCAVSATNTPVPTNTPSCSNTAPGLPNLNLPANGANVGAVASQTVSVNDPSIGFGTCCTGNNNQFIFSWGTDTGATNKGVFLAQNSSDKDVVLTGLLSNTTYYWKALAQNGCLNSGDTTPRWFVTAVPSPTPIPPTPTPTVCPTNLTSSCSANGTQATLSWMAATGPTTYSVTLIDRTAEPDVSTLYTGITDKYKVVNTLCNNWYSWWMVANPGDCAASGAWFNCPCPTATPTPTATPIPNRSPLVTSLIIRNSSLVIVPVETGNRNHICQTNFNNSRRVVFEANVSDADGWADIATATLSWNGHSYTMSKLSGSGTTGIMRAIVDFVPGENNSGVFPLAVIVYDISNAQGTGTFRSWKVWDCKVSVSGTVYDSSADGLGTVVCSNGTGYSVPIEEEVGFDSLVYEDKSMTVTSPTYSDGGNKLIFGEEYTPEFNSDFNGSNPVSTEDMRVSEIVGGVPVYRDCVRNTLNISSAIVSPYQLIPAIQVDFTTVATQDSWFQVAGGGAAAGTKVNDNIPVTCANDIDCMPVIAIGSANGTNGLVAAPEITNDSGCGDLCGYGEPNNWGLEENVVGERFDYNYFLNNYYNKLGVGKMLTANNWYDAKSELGDEKIGFRQGSFIINQDIVTAPGSFFMLVVSGTITVTNNVKKIEGIFVANSGINIGSESTNQLVVNGTLYSPGNVNLTRSYVTKSTNNTTPAVLVNFRPDFIFNMPPALTKTLSNWKEGR